MGRTPSQMPQVQGPPPPPQCKAAPIRWHGGRPEIWNAKVWYNVVLCLMEIQPLCITLGL
jgi:hypothetical protein